MFYDEQHRFSTKYHGQFSLKFKMFVVGNQILLLLLFFPAVCHCKTAMQVLPKESASNVNVFFSSNSKIALSTFVSKRTIAGTVNHLFHTIDWENVKEIPRSLHLMQVYKVDAHSPSGFLKFEGKTLFLIKSFSLWIPKTKKIEKNLSICMWYEKLNATLCVRFYSVHKSTRRTSP